MLQQNNRTNQEKEREGNPKWWIQPKNVVKESPQMAGLENNQANDQEQRSWLQSLQGKKGRKTNEIQNIVEHLEKLNVSEWKLGKRKKEHFEKFSLYNKWVHSYKYWFLVT